ncbi:putative peptidoglycan biosynthesis protein MurJ [compost metagenome]
MYWKLRQQQLFQPQPGWPKFLAKLVLAVLVMSAVLVGVMQLMPEWEQGLMLERFLRLGVVIAAGVIAYFGTLLILGFRLRDFARKTLH